MELNRSRNKPKQLQPTDFLTKVPKNFLLEKELPQQVVLGKLNIHIEIKSLSVILYKNQLKMD
jgi:hypothetical protein